MFLVAAREHCACWCVSSAVVVLMASPDMSRSGSCLGFSGGRGRVCCVVGVRAGVLVWLGCVVGVVCGGIRVCALVWSCCGVMFPWGLSFRHVVLVGQLVGHHFSGSVMVVSERRRG